MQASAIGLTRLGGLRLVVLPQAITRMVPPCAASSFHLIKDSSIVSLVSVQDLTFMANEVAVRHARVRTWIAASAIYFVLCFGLSLMFGRWERKLEQDPR